MKIAINCRLWLPGRLEGVGFFLQEVVSRWLENRPEDEFHLLFDRSTTLDFSDLPNATTHVLYPQARHPILYKIWFDLVVPWHLRRIKPDVFFSPEPMCALTYSGRQVITVHDLAYLHYPETFAAKDVRYYGRNMPRFIKKAEHIITVSEFTREDICQQFPTAANRITVAHNGCRPVFQPLHTDAIRSFRAAHTEGLPYFFYYGSLNARKNIHNLLRGFEKWKKDTGGPHRLVIGGRQGWKTEELERVYKDHSYQKEIQFTGYLEDAELHKWLGAATALTYISHFEGFGLPVLEAMQAGVPAITTRGSSMEEIAKKAAYYVDPNSPEEIATAMTAVTGKEKERANRIKMGLLRARQFTWERTAATIWEVL